MSRKTIEVDFDMIDRTVEELAKLILRLEKNPKKTRKEQKKSKREEERNGESKSEKTEKRRRRENGRRRRRKKTTGKWQTQRIRAFEKGQSNE